MIRPNGRIWVSAEQFYRAAEQIWTTEGVDLNAFVFPLIVNYALCAELSLKAEGCQDHVHGTWAQPVGCVCVS